MGSFHRPNSLPRKPPWYRRLAVAATACLIVLPAAEANPLDPTVRHGVAAFARAGGALTVTNTAGTIIDWRQFSIAAGEVTHFAQPGADSAVLNRVTGGDPSAILGRLGSNGRVFLVNPQGIVFGAGARIDAAGLVASTLDISNEDFLAGRLRFAGESDAAVSNAGVIRTDGDVHLVGARVENSGLIASAAGSVVLAAGRAVTITSADAHGVAFEVQAPADAAVNLGTIAAGTAAANSNATAAPLFQPAAAGSASVVNITTLQSAVNAGGTVTLDTTVAGGGGSGNGAITFTVAPSFAPGAPAVLNLKAHRNITLASLAESGTSSLTVNFLANQAGPAGGIARINGPVTSNGGLALGGVVTVLGEGTSYAPNFRVLNGATVTLDSGGAADFVFNGGTVEVDGTLAWEGNAFDIRGAFGTTFNINAGGVFDIRNDRTMLVFGGAGGAALNVLAGGTLRKSAGAGTTTLSAGQGWTLTNAGTVEALAGR
jgi:filamentous hemagglutinin family protein